MTLTVYSTPWCGYCRRLEAQLGRAGVPFREVDIEADPQAEEFVRTVNGGAATVPTVVLPDGSALTNPSLREILNRLNATG